MDKEEMERISNNRKGLGYVSERERRGRGVVRIPYGTYTKIKEIAEKEGVSIGQVIAARFVDEDMIQSRLDTIIKLLTEIKEK